MKYIILLLIPLTLKAFAIEVILATGINSDAPYVYGDEKIDPIKPGITIEVLRLIEQRSDIEFVVSKMPWTRVVQSVKTNQLSGGFHFSYKAERAHFVSYPILDGQALPNPVYSLYEQSYVIYQLKNQPSEWVNKSLQGDKRRPLVGIIRGSSIASKLKELGYALEEVSHDAQLPKLLLSGRIDAYAGLENMHDAELASLTVEQNSQIEKLSPVLETKPYYIGFSASFYENHKDVAWKIWSLIAEIKQNGELEGLYAKYGYQ